MVPGRIPDLHEPSRPDQGRIPGGLGLPVASGTERSQAKRNTHLEFYKCMYNITWFILKTVSQNSGNVMFVRHAATLEACTRQLVGAQPRSAQELTKMVQKIPIWACVWHRRACTARGTLSIPRSLPSHTNPTFASTGGACNDF